MYPETVRRQCRHATLQRRRKMNPARYKAYSATQHSTKHRQDTTKRRRLKEFRHHSTWTIINSTDGVEQNGQKSTTLGFIKRSHNSTRTPVIVQRYSVACIADK